MAFWGVQVKPGKPVTHSYENARRRLRISQATLGFGEASEKTVVQCNVGNRSPVLLFALLPNKRESCRLDLEFEEADDVVFSVIGPRSVHLTGYYVQRNQRSNPHSDTESYGVDIENTQTDGSSRHSDDDVYEDSFINDDEIKVSSQSPLLSSKGIDDAALENDKLKERQVCGKKLKKKNQAIESDNDANPLECEDGDGSLSVSRCKRAVKTTMSDAEEMIAQATEERDDEGKNDDIRGSKSNQNVDPLDINDKQEGEKKPSLDEKRTEVNEENSELPEEMEDLAKIIFSIQDVIHKNNTKDTSFNQNLPASDGKDLSGTLNHAKPEKKRKERSVKKKKKKMSKAKTDKVGHRVLRENEEHEVEASTNLGIGENYLGTPPELGSIDVQQSKKRRNELQLEGSLTEVIGEKYQNIPKESNQEITPMESEGQSTKTVPLQKMTLSNGLVIEELASGHTDGKVAAPGKKVTLHYTARLKKSGYVFDSTVGQAAYQFRLGDEEIIDGWNAGIVGMRVGDKRRLIIPPSMGFGDYAMEDVPPNSWLVYDIELVSVRK